MDLFLELIQISLGTRDGFSRIPSKHEWQELYAEAGKQAIVGILLAGLERLPAEHLPPLHLRLQWIGEAKILENRNRLMNQRCMKLLELLGKAELKGTILKGQGIALLYDKRLRGLRQPGDIDVFVDCGLERAIGSVEGAGLRVEKWDYKHASLRVWDDTEVEMHYRVEILFNPWKNKRLQRWFDNELGDLYGLNPVAGLVTPNIGFNLFYILLHIYRHFLYEGVGLRQVVDYFFVLKMCSSESPEERERIFHLTSSTVRQFGLQRFAGGLMWVMQEVMAMSHEWMPWQPEEKEGRYILAQIMEGGNFGHYSAFQTRKAGGISYVNRVVRHSLHIMRRYPSEALWPPVWLVWHKVWKVVMASKLRKTGGQ